MSQVELGFVLESLSMPIDKILPSRQVPEGLLISRKFAQIKASIEAVGLIEPLSVGKLDKGKRVLLDGHIRLIALRDLGYTEVPCLESTDDESFTYNNRINRLSTIQEHHMLRRAVERGVSAERLRVHRYSNGELAVFHGPRKLADYNREGKVIPQNLKQAA